MYKIISDKIAQRLSDGAFITKGSTKVRGHEVFSNAWLAYTQWLESEEGQAAMLEFRKTTQNA